MKSLTSITIVTTPMLFVCVATAARDATAEPLKTETETLSNQTLDRPDARFPLVAFTPSMSCLPIAESSLFWGCKPFHALLLNGGGDTRNQDSPAASEGPSGEQKRPAPVFNSELDYSFFCHSGAPITAMLSLFEGDKSIQFLLEKSDSHEHKTLQTGEMNLALARVELDLSLKSISPVSSDCLLVVEAVRQKISDGTRSQWLSEKKTLEKNLREFTKARDTAADLLLYRSGFEILGRIVRSLSSDLLRNRELRQALDSGDPLATPPRSASAAYDALVALSTANSEVVAPETLTALRKLLRLVDTLSSLPECKTDDNACQETIISSYISKEDQSLLSNLSNRLSDESASKASYQHFAELVQQTEADTIALCQASHEWIVWEPLPAGCGAEPGQRSHQ